MVLHANQDRVIVGERNKGYECTSGRRPTVGEKKYATKHMQNTAMRCHMHHAIGKMDAS
jgi:hypothetical protein